MADLWPWLAVAGTGALHGLNPCTGWGLAAACGVLSRRDSQALAALLPIALGHAVSIAAVASAIATGLSMTSLPLQVAAVALLLCMGVRRWRPMRGTRLAVSSFIAATAHGTGLMLVPALVPLCLSNSPAKAIIALGSATLVLAVVAVHMAAMLATTAAVALGACRVWPWAQSRLGWGQPGAAAEKHPTPRCQAANHSAGG